MSLEDMRVLKIVPNVPSDVRVMDCIEGMKTLPENSVDVVVTSPPYNLKKGYTRYVDSREESEYLEWCKEWAAGIARVLKPDGSFFLNFAGSPAHPTLPFDLLMVLLQKYVDPAVKGSGGPFVLQNTIHWVKSITVVDDDGKEVTQGHFKPINSARYLNDCHEYLFHLTLGGDTKLDRLAVGVAYKHKSNVNRWKTPGGRDRRCRGNLWYLPYKTIQSKADQRPHPASFPSSLPERCLRLHGLVEGETVMMDPFLGIGHSWQAGLRCRVGKFIGFDVDPEYVEVARGFAADPDVIWD